MNNNTMKKTALQQITQFYADEIERLLVTELEKIVGRVPTDEEVAEHAHCVIAPDNRRQYTWKGKVFLFIGGWHLEGDKVVIDYGLPKPEEEAEPT